VAWIRRLAQAFLTLFVASVLVWSLLLLAPGDPARRVLNSRGILNPTEAQITQTREELGLTRPAYSRYADWLSRVVRGDLSESWKTGRPVQEEFARRLLPTLRLAGVASILALALALPLAFAGAIAPGRWPDALSRWLSLAWVSAPSFLIGVILLHIVVLRWGWGQVVADGSWRSAFLPGLTLALPLAGAWARILRAGLLEASGALYLRVCAGRGATLRRQMIVHALPNALVPFLTIIGVGVGGLLGGAAIVETIFTWPGIGQFTVEAIGARDVPVIQGYALLAVVIYVASSLLVDALIRLLDPRLRAPTTRSSRLARVKGWHWRMTKRAA
jgi:ABC-type dipeptide/oligopeptide/nickel transport system permease component